MTNDLDKLEGLAKAATKGPWKVVEDTIVISETSLLAHVCDEYGWADENHEANAVYIAAANPAVILALIAELRGRRESDND